MASRKGTGTRKRIPAKRASKAKSSSTGGAKRKRLSPREKVRRSQETVLKEMPEIVENICGEAKKGSHTAAKFIFDFAGITELQSPLQEPPSQDSLASILMEKLGNPSSSPEPKDSSGTVE